MSGWAQWKAQRFLLAGLPLAWILIPGPRRVAAVESAHQDSRLSIVERWSTKGGPGGLEFASIAGMAEAANGDIWISDPAGHRLLASDAAGRRLRVVARQGDGPGEVEGPGLVTTTASGEVAVLDLARGSVDVFGRDGRFTRRTTLPARVYNPKGFVYWGGRFVISGGITGETSAIHLVGADGSRKGSWYPAPRTRNPRAGVMVAGGALAVAPDGSLLFSQAAPHRILRFPPAGGAGRELAADSALLRPAGDDFIREAGGVRTFRWDYPRSGAVFPRPDGTVLNVICNAEQGFTLWELYGRDGRRLARQRVDRAYEPWAMTRDGDVLASFRDPTTDEAVAVRLAVRAPLPPAATR